MFSVHLECANADSHVHIFDEPPVFLCDAHVLGMWQQCLSKVIQNLCKVLQVDWKLYWWCVWCLFVCVCVCEVCV